VSHAGFVFLAPIGYDRLMEIHVAISCGAGAIQSSIDLFISAALSDEEPSQSDEDPAQKVNPQGR